MESEDGAVVSVRPFGACPAGEVECVTLSDGAGMAVEVLTLGAAVRSILVPDRDGRPVDVCLGYDTAREYWDQDAYLGACVGRCANRLAGARFTLNGREWRLTPNEGPNQLHGGAVGFDKKLWTYALEEKSATFTLESPHGEEGYPGHLHVEVTYALTAPGELTVSYRAVSDGDTVVNLTNHSYFNLSGQGSGPVDGHTLTVAAEEYTPCGPGNIPTGALRAVAGTALDLRSPTRLGDRLDDPALAQTRGFDHNFALRPGPGPAALLHSPDTGLTLAVSTTLPGVQVYTAGFLTQRRGKGGAAYAPRHAVCLETQHFPDAVHHEEFPSPILRAGEQYSHSTVYRFSR